MWEDLTLISQQYGFLRKSILHIHKMQNITITQLRKTLQDNSKSDAEREIARKELLKILGEEEKRKDGTTNA